MVTLPEVIAAALKRGLHWPLRIYENFLVLVSYHCHPSLHLGIEELVEGHMKRGWARKPSVTSMSPAAISCSGASQEKQTTRTG